MTLCQNPVCDMPAQWKRGGRCNACYMYHWRHSVERPVWLTNNRAPIPQCATDGCERPRRSARGSQAYCAACYYYRWRTGRDRPAWRCLRQMDQHETCARCGRRKFTIHSRCWACRRNQARRSRSKVA